MVSLTVCENNTINDKCDLSETDFDKPIQDCLSYFLEGFRPPPEISIADWSDENRIIPSEASGEPGQWRTSRVPYMREIMDELSPSSHTEDVAFMKGSQIAATETMMNCIIYNMANAPGPILWVEPTIDQAKTNSKQRLQPSIAACEQLKGKVSDNKSRDKGNTTLQKDFPGGILKITGANSAAGLRSMPARYLYADEIDGYPRDADGEGDPLELAIRRTTNFSRKKRFYASTPTIAGSSRIEKKFNESDQRYFYVPCPYCKKPQIIKWSNIKYLTDDSGALIEDSVHLKCDHCKAEIREYHKPWMLEHGQWIKHKPKAKMAGFHLSALYSPLGWFSWVDAVRSHLAAIGDPLLRKVWVNTVLGEVFSEITPTIDSHWLAKRVEKYDAIVPEGVLCLTAGADTHDDRVEISVYGWGEKGECWLIDHCIFLGNTKQSDVWELVDQHLLMQWEHRSGAMMNIATTCIDSQGHATDEVYGFVLPRQWRRVWAIKGMAGAGRGIVSRASKQKNGVYLILVGADQGKDYLYANLKNIVKPGPGYIHFPDTVDEKFFDQLTAERKLIRHSAGLPKSQWDLPAGKRNEALDCFVYAYAALKVLNPNLELLAQEKRVYQSDFTRPVAKKARRVISRGAQI